MKKFFFENSIMKACQINELKFSAVPVRRQMANYSIQLRCHHLAVVTGVEVTLERVDARKFLN